MRRLLPFLVVLLCGTLLGATRATERYDLKLLDLQFELLRTFAPRDVSRDVVVIGIDDESARRLPEPIALWHAHWGRLFSALATARPAAVGLDLVLPDRSYDAVVPGSDRALLKGLLETRRSFPLVLGLTVDVAGKLRPIYPPFLTIAGPDSSGYALFPVDSDGVVRRFNERLSDEGTVVPTLVGQMARRMNVRPRAGLIDYWRGAPFHYVPLHQVLHWAENGDEQALAEAFRSKPVLIGTVFAYEDHLPAPVQLAAWEPETPSVAGVLLHAQALRSLLNGGPVQKVPAYVVAIACAVLAALWFISAETSVVVTILLAVILLLAGSSTGLLTQGWYFPVASLALTAALALAGRNGYDTLLKLRERRRLRASFGGYVSPSVMEEILSGQIHPELGGASKFVCVLFSDIRGYTTRSEQMTPEQVIQFLNRYFERTVSLIHERGGAVTSFMGDGIMAIFGAPQETGNPCNEAFEAARSMLAYVTELNAQFQAEGVATIDIGIGLHAGQAVIGHVGSSVRHDYTAIGDVTNVASRLESLTKEAGYRIIVSSRVAEELIASKELASLGPMAIKGHTPVEVFGYERINN